MSRNPHASNLRHFKPKRIEGKREKLLGKFYEDALDEIMEADREILERLAEREARECPTGNSAR